MFKKSRLIIWAIIAVLILLLFLAMLFADEVQWNEVIAYGLLLSAIGGFYELGRWLKTCQGAYRFAFGFGFTSVLFLGWVSGAIGIIGSENNPANLMYGAVFVAWIIGSLISRFRSRGMAWTFLVMAFIQMSVPIFALFVWPAQASWGEAGVIGVLVFNSIFVGLFVSTALLFRRASARLRAK